MSLFPEFPSAEPVAATFAGVPMAEGLGAIVDRFDALTVDQFGVLHDGVAPYPGVVAALRRVAELGLPVVVLTNSGKPAEASRARLGHLGIPGDLVERVVSSGDVARAGIASGAFGAPFRPGARVFVVGRAGDDYGLEGLGLDLVEAPEAADFLMILGSNAPDTTLDDYERGLAAAARAGVPALCANPDRTLILPHGLYWAAGAIAARYGALGAPVTYVGKPYGRIFRAALDLLPGVTAARVGHVGDSVEHDVKGGRAAGLTTVLVRTGIDAERSEAEMARLFAETGARPDVVLPAFRW